MEPLEDRRLLAVWTQQGADLDGEAGADSFGSSVALSDDGSRVVVGAFKNDGIAGYNSGHTRVFANQVTALALGPATPSPRTEPVVDLNVEFSNPIDPLTFTAADITLTHDSTPLDTSSLLITDLGGQTFQISGLAALTDVDGDYELSVDVSAIDDTFGRPGLGSASTSWLTDSQFPAKLPIDPLGSLIYDPAVSRSLPNASDVQALEITLDAGQTLTAFVQPNNTLQPTLSVTAPGGGSLGSTSATAPGENIILQTLPVATAGTYTLTTGVAGGNTGNFTISVLLNATQEEESLNGTANDSVASAQSIEPSFVTLVGDAERGAALGTVGGSNSEDYYSFSLEAGELVSLAMTGISSGVLELRDASGVLTTGIAGATNVDLSITSFAAPAAGTYFARVANSGSASGYSLIVTRGAIFELENNSSSDILYGVGAPDSEMLIVDPTTGASTVFVSNVGDWYGYLDLAYNPDTGTMYGSQAQGGSDLFTVDLTTGAETVVGSVGSGTRAMAWSPDGTTLYAAQDYDFGTIDPVSGSFTSIVDPGLDKIGGLASQPGTGTLFAVQHDGTGLYTIDPATGTATFVANLGEYFNALEFLPDGTLLGGVSNYGDDTGWLLEIDPVLELFDPTGASVGSDDNSDPDGRNAVLSHTALMTGTYTVLVTGASGTSGEYILSQQATAPPVVIETSAEVVSGDLIVTDVNGGDTDDDWTFAVSGSDLIITDNNGNGIDLLGTLDGTGGDGGSTVTVALADFASLDIRTLAGADTINIEGLNLETDESLSINAGDGTDTLNFQTASTTLLGTGAVDATAETINVDADVTTATGDINLGRDVTIYAAHLGSSFWGNDGGIRRISGSTVTDVVSNIDVAYMVIDKEAGHIYYQQYLASGTKLQRANLDGTGITTVTTSVGWQPRDMEIDSVNEHIYIGHDANPGLTVKNFDGTNATPSPNPFTNGSTVALDLINNRVYGSRTGVNTAELDYSTGLAFTNYSTNILSPGGTDLEVDPANGYLFANGGGILQRADLDGSNPITIATGIRFLEVDSAAGKIYWGLGSSIQRANLDGSGVETIVSGVFDDLWSFDIISGAPATDINVNAALTTAGGDVSMVATGDVNVSDTVSGNDIGISGHDIDVSAQMTAADSAKITSSSGTVDINAAVNVGAGGLDIDPPDTITVSAPINSAGGPVNLEANNGVTLSGAAADVTTAGGTYTVDSDADDDGIGTYEQDDAGSAVSTAGGDASITATDVDLTGTIDAGAGAATFLTSLNGEAVRFAPGSGIVNVVDDFDDETGASPPTNWTRVQGTVNPTESGGVVTFSAPSQAAIMATGLPSVDATSTVNFSFGADVVSVDTKRTLVSLQPGSATSSRFS